MVVHSCRRRNSLRSGSAFTQEKLIIGFYTQELGKDTIGILITVLKDKETDVGGIVGLDRV